MGVRQWMKQRWAEGSGEDVPPGSSLLNVLLGKEVAPVHSLGEYTAQTYPQELTQLVQRRQQVTDEVIAMDITRPDARVAAIPRLQQLLQIYPHPLVYETLIHAYADAGRYDEAKGVAFAARERRIECGRSPYPEIRSEVDFLHEWDPAEVDQLREEREGKQAGQRG